MDTGVHLEDENSLFCFELDLTAMKQKTPIVEEVWFLFKVRILEPEEKAGEVCKTKPLLTLAPTFWSCKFTSFYLEMKILIGADSFRRLCPLAIFLVTVGSNSSNAFPRELVKPFLQNVSSHLLGKVGLLA